MFSKKEITNLTTFLPKLSVLEYVDWGTLQHCMIKIHSLHALTPKMLLRTRYNHLIVIIMIFRAVLFPQDNPKLYRDKRVILSFEVLKALSYFYLLKMEQSVS